jgi:hypothetical protein
MTYREWSKRPDLIESLAEFLNSPVLIQALAVLTEEQLPKTTLRSDSPNLMENHALLNAKREGYFDFLRNLRALALHRPEPAEKTLAPWKYSAEQE